MARGLVVCGKSHSPRRSAMPCVRGISTWRRAVATYRFGIWCTRSSDGSIQWSATESGQSLYVRKHRGLPVLPVEVDRLELGGKQEWKRERWHALTPSDPAGVTEIGPILIAADGKSYAYTYSR